ncbi:hypothetical protein ACH5RR_021326 [Cinchona calisaya]|uniref:Uncharacterized protein n=1 Tax=Cinchona calisaya TaxID=153742 RepID=A0ABD2ZJV4_9GENT
MVNWVRPFAVIFTTDTFPWLKVKMIAPKVHRPISVSWQSHPLGKLKLNVDGPTLDNPRSSGGGGLVYARMFYLDPGWPDVLVESDSQLLRQMLLGSISIP